MKLAIADRSLALLPMAVDDMIDSAIGIHRRHCSTRWRSCSSCCGSRRSRS